MTNRIFFPQDAVDQWVVDEHVDVAGSDLTIRSDGRRFRLAEAVHVVREVTGASDIYDVVGRVRARPSLEEMGAEILERSMIIGDNAYDVVPGWLATPVGTFAEHLASQERRRIRAERGLGATDDASSDEELIARALLGAG